MHPVLDYKFLYLLYFIWSKTGRYAHAHNMWEERRNLFSESVNGGCLSLYVVPPFSQKIIRVYTRSFVLKDSPPNKEAVISIHLLSRESLTISPFRLRRANTLVERTRNVWIMSRALAFSLWLSTHNSFSFLFFFFLVQDSNDRFAAANCRSWT